MYLAAMGYKRAGVKRGRAVLVRNDSDLNVRSPFAADATAAFGQRPLLIMVSL